MSNKDVKQDALDNLADALTEDILNTPDDELLREVEDDYGNPRALANKFDQILERAEKRVFETARSAASPQVRSSVLDLPYRLLEWFSTLFGRGPARSETQFQLFSVNRMVWAGAAAVLIVLILAPVVFRSMFDETQVLSSVPQAPPPDQNSKGSRLAVAPVVAPVAAVPSPFAVGPSVVSHGAGLGLLAPPAVPTTPVAGVPPVAAVPPVLPPVFPPEVPPVASVTPPVASVAPGTPPVAAITDATPEEIAKAVRRGLQLLAQSQIAEARQLLLRWGAERDATAALALGTSYDPIELQKLPRLPPGPSATVISNTASPNVAPDSFADIAMARTWYQKAKDLGSIEADKRLESLAGSKSKSR